MSDMCDDNRFDLIEKYKKKLIEATNIETASDEMTVLDDILFRFWQMGWLDSIDRMLLVKESAKTLMHSVGDSVSAKAFRNAGRFIQNAIDGETPEFEKIPSAHPGCDEWCTDCKEYDQQKHSCPRWNRVIRQTVEDVRKEIPETTRILAEVLTGSPLLYPCDKLWSREGWCKEHCKKGQTEPDTECWLKYAETIATERRDEK